MELIDSLVQNYNYVPKNNFFSPSLFDTYINPGTVKQIIGSIENEISYFLKKRQTKGKKYSDDLNSIKKVLDKLNNNQMVTGGALVYLAVCVINFVYCVNSYYSIDNDIPKDSNALDTLNEELNQIHKDHIKPMRDIITRILSAGQKIPEKLGKDPISQEISKFCYHIQQAKPRISEIKLKIEYLRQKYEQYKTSSDFCTGAGILLIAGGTIAAMTIVLTPVAKVAIGAGIAITAGSTVLSFFEGQKCRTMIKRIDTLEKRATNMENVIESLLLTASNLNK